MEQQYNEMPADQQMQYPQQMGYGTPMDNYNSSIILLTSTDSQLRKLELKLRNCTEDENGNIIPITENTVAKLNDEGISTIIGLVQPVASRNAIFGYYDEREINALMLRLVDEIARTLIFNRIKFEIKSRDVMSEILYQSVMTAFTCLKRGQGEGERKFWKGSVQEVRHTTNQEKKEGLLSKLPFTGGK